MDGNLQKGKKTRSESDTFADTYDTFRKGNTAFYSGRGMKSEPNVNNSQNRKVSPHHNIRDSITIETDRKTKRSLSAEEIEEKLPNLRQGRGVYGSLPFLATFGMQHREKSVASAVRLRSFESMSKIKVSALNNLLSF